MRPALGGPKEEERPVPMFGSDPPSTEQKEPHVLSAVSVRGRGGLVFLWTAACLRWVSLRPLHAASTLAPGTAGVQLESLGVCTRILVER